MGVFFHLLIPHSHCSESTKPVYNIISSVDCVIPDECSQSRVHDLLHGSDAHSGHTDGTESDGTMHFSDNEFTVKNSKSFLLKLQLIATGRFMFQIDQKELYKSELILSYNNSHRLPQPPFLLTSRNKAPPA